MPTVLTSTTLTRKKVPLGEHVFIADAACPGLRVRIGVSKQRLRTVSFYYWYRDRNTRKLINVMIGHYPGLELEDARILVKSQLRPIADEGGDVRRYLKNKKRESADSAKKTIRSLAPSFLDTLEKRKRSESTKKTYRRYLRAIVHYWGDLLPEDITRGDVEDLFDRVKAEGVPPFDIDGTPIKSFGGQSRGGHRAAGHLLSAGQAFWKWLLDREVVNFNPWAGREKLREESRPGIATRALSDDEMKSVLQTAGELLSPRDAAATKLLLATGLRPMEVCAAEWKEFDIVKGVWSIPAERMKYKKAGHTVYLSRYAIQTLKKWRKQLKGKPRYVFPAEGKRYKHLSPDNLGENLTRFELEGFTPKVCRATVRTGLQRLGCPEEVRQRISHHQRGDRVSRSYDQYAYDAEAKHWWNQWSIHLQALYDDQPGLAEVVNLR